MKIAMLTNNYRPFVGGVPISVERQAHQLIKLGHEVTVFAPAYGDTEEKDKNVPERVIRYHSSKKTMENGMVYPEIWPREILDMFSKESFDIIHVHHPMFVGPWALYLGKKYDIPVIYTYHTRYEDYVHYIPCFRLQESSFALKKKAVQWIRKAVIPRYIKWFANQCDLVFCPSAGMRHILREYGMTASSAILPTGLDEDFFHSDEAQTEKIRRQYGKGRKHLLVTVSRLEKEKNYGFLLRGIAEMRHRMGDDFHVLVIGDGRQRGELKVKASILGIQQFVTFIGNIPNTEVKNYLRAADAFLFASRSETQGIVLAEAMAAGTPVVAVHAVGVDDIVKDGVNGFLTEENEKAWADGVIRVLDPDTNRALAEQARMTAQGYKASSLAIYEEMLYNQCVRSKQEERRRQELRSMEGMGVYEDKENRSEHSAMVIR